jgi:transposase-like protein
MYARGMTVREIQGHLEEMYQVSFSPDLVSRVTDEATIKLPYLALKNVSKRWKKPIMKWTRVLNQFAIIFEDRLPTSP